MQRIKTYNYKLLYLINLLILLTLSGCKTTGSLSGQDGPPGYDVDVSQICDAVPKSEPMSRYGNPKSYTVLGHRYCVMNSSRGYVERGFASWYGTKFHAKRTSSGEPYSMLTMTAAHKTLPLPTYVQVTNLKNGKHVIVKVNDRGPFHENRIIDLSYVAAKKLSITGHGTGLVEVRAIIPGESTPTIKTSLLAQNQPTLYLQIGAFANRENAENLTQRIKNLTSFSTRINESDHAGKPIYKVQIGPLANSDKTDALHHKLEAAGLGDAVTVIE